MASLLMYVSNSQFKKIVIYTVINRCLERWRQMEKGAAQDEIVLIASLITDSMDVNFSKRLETVESREAWCATCVHGVTNSNTKLSDWTELSWKNPPAHAGDIKDTRSILGSGRSPGVWNGNPLQYSCLEIPWTEEARRLYSPRGHKGSDTTKAS